MEKIEKIEDDIALLFEKDYKNSITLQAVINILDKLGVIKKEELKKEVERLRKNQ